MISSIPKKKPRKPTVRTYKGRVVYDRKPHLFSITDIGRISYKLREPRDLFEGLSYVRIAANIALNIMKLAQPKFKNLWDFAREVLDTVFRIVLGFENVLKSTQNSEILVALKLISPPQDEPAPALVQLGSAPAALEPFSLGERWYWIDPVTGYRWERVWVGLH